MKKIIALLLAIILCLTFVACGAKDKDDSSDSKASGSSGGTQSGQSDNAVADVMLSCSRTNTMCLRSDGTVLSTDLSIPEDGDQDYAQSGVDGWTDIIAISTGNRHTVGLKSDGTVVTTDVLTESAYRGQCEVGDWTDIVAIAAGHFHTVGLRSNGTFVYAGRNDYGQCDLDDWKLN